MDSFFDIFAECCGEKEFFDMDGNGHIDAIEGGLMLAAMDDEISELDRVSPCAPSGSQWAAGHEANVWDELI